MADISQARIEAITLEVRAHNCGVIVRRRRGESWEAPENQYRNANAEIAALSSLPADLVSEGV